MPFLYDGSFATKHDLSLVMDLQIVALEVTKLGDEGWVFVVFNLVNIN